MSKRTYLVSTLKGGPGKTTTAMYLAIGLAWRGHRVAAIDADPRSQGLDDWYRLMIANYGKVPIDPPGSLSVAAWSPVTGREGTGLVAYVEHVARELSADRVVIDTGGEHPEIFSQACVVADQLVCPVGPMAGELRRMPATFHAAALVAAHHPFEMAALLTRVPGVGVGAAREARAVLEAADIAVLRTEIPQRRREFADAWGRVPRFLGEYSGLIDELEGE